jgi:hypothetical protein
MAIRFWRLSYGTLRNIPFEMQPRQIPINFSLSIFDWADFN